MALTVFSEITPLPERSSGTKPDADGELWNARYTEVNLNFELLEGGSAGEFWKNGGGWAVPSGTGSTNGHVIQDEGTPITQRNALDFQGDGVTASNGVSASKVIIPSSAEEIAAASEKTTPVDADKLGIFDSAAAGVLKWLSWSNVKATLKTYFDTLYVSLTGAQTIAGVKTFSSFLVTPSSAPTTDYQVANKKYVDDQTSGYTSYTGQNASMAQNDTLEVSYPVEPDVNKKIITAYREVLGSATDWSDLDMDVTDEDNFLQFDVKGTAVNFEVDTANVSGHFENSGNSPVSIGSGNTEPKIQIGVRFKIAGDSEIYEITAITGDGTANDAVEFSKLDGTAATKTTGTYGVDYAYGTLFFSGVIKLNDSGEEAVGYSTTFTTTTDAWAEYSLRQVIESANISASGGRVRVTFESGAAEGASVDNVSIVERSGSTANGTETPTELLFSGSSGFSITANTTITSDWLVFDIDETKDYIIIIDFSSNASADAMKTQTTSGISYFKSSSNSYDQQSVTGYGETDPRTVGVKQLDVSSTAYPVDEIYTVVTTDANQADCSDWDDVDNVFVTETLNSQNNYYSVSFDNRVTFGIWDNTSGDDGWRPITRNNSGDWQYNSNATPGATDITWTNAATAGENSQESALAQAMAITANQMTGTEFAAITDADWNDNTGGMNGWSTSTETINFGFGLKSSSSSATPEISQITLTYLAPTYWEPLVNDDDWDFQVYSSKARLIKLNTGTDNVKLVARIE